MGGKMSPELGQQLAKAIRIAAVAHEGQVDKAGQPYILHVLRVMFGCTTPEAQIAAALHDVVEDTAWTLDDLRAEGFGATVVAIVDALTRREGEEYFAFARRAAATPLSREVKRSDLLDNMDVRRLAQPAEQDWERIKRYRKALDIIDAP
jgi:(p)ppGpp synthase/HD superfamily hydrolase